MELNVNNIFDFFRVAASQGNYKGQAEVSAELKHKPVTSLQSLLRNSQSSQFVFLIRIGACTATDGAAELGWLLRHDGCARGVLS